MSIQTESSHIPEPDAPTTTTITTKPITTASRNNPILLPSPKPKNTCTYDPSPEPDSNSNSDSGLDSDSIPYCPTEVHITFFPSLNDTRRAWILRKLKEERVTSVLDAGCGAGTLLACLCYPPTFLETETDQSPYPNPSLYRSCTSDTLPNLHITRLAGLDISPRALEKCIINTATPTASHYLYMPRWEGLEVKIWLGSLDVYNPEFKDIECIVSSEVIEHLPPSILPRFAQTLLGLYRPRILLITTPNYAFNPRFSPPGRVDPSGFRDPTGRTDRVFRHSDHKFEWTPLEFKAWCTEAAASWGYTVEIDAVGKPMEKDPWARDEELGNASQVAIFRRNDDWKDHRTETTPLNQEPTHKCLETFIHHPHPQAGKAEPPERILKIVIKYMESYYFENGYSIWDLWVENTISVACGGRLDALLRAIESSPELCLHRKDGAPARDWNVIFSGDKHREAAEASRTRYWDRGVSQEPSPWGYRAIALENDSDTKELPKEQDPLQDWYSLAREVSLDEEEKLPESIEGWRAKNPWSAAWNESNTTDVYA